MVNIKSLFSFGKSDNNKKIVDDAKDPVCGMHAGDKITLEHNGRVYHFCSDFCKTQFVQHPEQYVTE